MGLVDGSAESTGSNPESTTVEIIKINRLAKMVLSTRSSLNAGCHFHEKAVPTVKPTNPEISHLR
jgi:hypothetical protein